MDDLSCGYLVVEGTMPLLVFLWPPLVFLWKDRRRRASSQTRESWA
jgi:hypothetical protein